MLILNHTDWIFNTNYAIIKELCGADTAFDNWTLTGYLASRPYALRISLVANTFASKIKDAATSFASMFRAPVFAPAVA